MLERLAAAESASAARSPNLLGRRLIYAALFTVTMAGMLALVTAALVAGAGGFGAVDLVIVLLFALTLPWMVIGFWNAVIGFVIMRLASSPVTMLIPQSGDIRGDEPIRSSTAILVCIRNETPDRIVRNLEPMLAGLVAAGCAARFHVYVLSDTDNAEIARSEEACFAALASRWRGRCAVTYRRREINAGYKAGNIRDFCTRWGGDHEFAVVLDADSFMTADAILRLVRIMERDARLGILQSLVVGLPSTSAFARLFQFGMRLGMRSYTVGSAWWQGDCGPYWGHNAILRLAPFMAHCELPKFPGGDSGTAHILSHDQIEAALMRRAGYDVRVMPVEDESWEENPPTLLEFIRRDLRWCEGNMQYWRFLTLGGLKAVNRCNLVIAILMFVGSPAWIGMLVLGTLAIALGGSGTFIDPSYGFAAFVLVLIMWFAPITAGAAEILLQPKARWEFGGAARFLANLAIEYVFSIMLCPIMWFCHTIFLGGLLIGREIGWIGQTRDNHMVPAILAVRNLWPHTLLGACVLALLAMNHAAAIPYALFLAGGLVLAVPFAIVTAMAAVGSWLVRLGIGRLPEETAPPAGLHARALATADTAAVRSHPI